MAQLDVSDLLLDPTFVDPLTLIRRTFTVATTGKAIITETSIPTYGSIQPASAKEIARLPDDLRLSDVRNFYIKIEILQTGSTAYPDVILYQGNRYQVKTAAPWLNYGRGWNVGLCIKETLTL